MQRSQGRQSTKHKNYYRRNRDLVTTIQAKFDSPMSQWQPTTQKHRQTKNTNVKSAKGSEIDQQLLEEINSLFITHEQQKIVREILQLARKGKISPGNAFEIPIKLVDPKCTESINMKFWKLASQLLGSSMNVYDKRVENLYLSSNKLTGELARIKDDNKQQGNGKQSSKDCPNANEDLIRSLGASIKITSNEIKYAHTQQIQKISLSEQKRVFFKDNFFWRKSKGIDSNILSGLMLNILEIGPDLGLALELSQPIKNEVTHDLMRETNEVIRSEIENQYRKLSQISKQKMVPQISRFKEKHFPPSKQETNLQQQFLQYFKKDSSSSTTYLQIDEEDTFFQVFNPPVSHASRHQTSHHHSQRTNINCGKKLGQMSILSCKEPFKRSLTEENQQDERDQFFTITGPWQIQTKKSKLNKKKPSRRQNNASKTATNENSSQIDFQFHHFLEKEEIIAMKHSSSFQNESEVIKKDKFIMPKTINPCLQVYKTKKLRDFISKTRNTQTYQEATNKESMFLTASLNDNNSHLQIHNRPSLNEHQTKIQQQDQIASQKGGQIQYSTFQEVNNPFGISKIRQIKQAVFQKLLCRSSIQISQYVELLAPAEMLVIFLHLANQKNLNIQPLESESDIRLSTYS